MLTARGDALDLHQGAQTIQVRRLGNHRPQHAGPGHRRYGGARVIGGQKFQQFLGDPFGGEAGEPVLRRRARRRRMGPRSRPGARGGNRL